MENVKHIPQQLFRELYDNTCPECGHDTLYLVEFEHTMNRLNKYGFIIETVTEGYQTKLQCANCGKEYHNVEHVGMAYRIKSNCVPIRKVMDDYNPFQS